MEDGTFTSPIIYHDVVCKNCGNTFKTTKENAIFCCNECYTDYIRINDVPSREELFNKLKRQTIKQTANDYGVCVDTIKRWAKKYNIRLKSIKRIKPKKEKPQPKYVPYENLPMTIVNVKEPTEKRRFKDIYALTEYFKDTFNTCDNDYTIRKNILRVINGERKSFHGYAIESKAYKREKRKATQYREFSNIEKELEQI
jgi:hypothetical protein